MSSAGQQERALGVSLGVFLVELQALGATRRSTGAGRSRIFFCCFSNCFVFIYFFSVGVLISAAEEGQVARSWRGKLGASHTCEKKET